MSRWRCIVVALLLVVGGGFYPSTMTAVSPDMSGQDPNSIVPSEFAGDMEWSEQGNWHWVVYSYSGENVTSGVTVQPPYFVATKVRSLSSEDPCDECLALDGNRQGPPLIMSGPDHPLLRDAYDNLSNGPRYKIADNGDESSEIWAAGAWYLNYNPTSDRFTSWTWIPDAQQGGATVPHSEDNSLDVDFAELGDFMAFLPEGSRVFPLAPGTYRLSQNFGCVAHNHGYQSSNSCPPDRPSFHNGTDFGAPEGTTIYAAASGTVTFADIDSSSLSGNSAIKIEHDGVNSAFLSEYLHWIRSYVKAGDYVYAGQPIAEVGSVGYSTGPHLHFTVKDVTTGVAIDPMVWLQSSVTPLLSTISADSAAVMNVLRWEPMMRVAAAKYDVPAALIAAIMTVESGGNPSAVSPAGAQGLMQIMPMHLTRYGIPSELWRDPATNIDAGARYLAESLSTGSTIQQTTARYFGIGCDVLGTCTDQYVARVLAWYAYYTALFAGDPLPEFPEQQVVVAAQASQPGTTSTSQPSGTNAPQAQSGDTSTPPDPPQEPESTQHPEQPPAPEPAPSEEPAAEPPPTEEPVEEATPGPSQEPSPTETTADESTDQEQPGSTESEQEAETAEPETADEPETKSTPEPEVTTEPDDPAQSSEEGVGNQQSEKPEQPTEVAPEEEDGADQEEQTREEVEQTPASESSEVPVDEATPEHEVDDESVVDETPVVEEDAPAPEDNVSGDEGGSPATESHQEITEIIDDDPLEDLQSTNEAIEETQTGTEQGQTEDQRTEPEQEPTPETDQDQAEPGNDGGEGDGDADPVIPLSKEAVERQPDDEIEGESSDDSNGQGDGENDEQSSYPIPQLISG